jgi:drug/metabolite transporter (DMT)-like permease
MVFFWVWGAVSGGLDFSFSRAGWLAVLGLALIPTVVGTPTFMQGARTLGATRASIVNAFEPVMAIVLAVLTLAERPNLAQILGGALVILASILVQLDSSTLTVEPLGTAPTTEA